MSCICETFHCTFILAQTSKIKYSVSDTSFTRHNIKPLLEIMNSICHSGARGMSPLMTDIRFTDSRKRGFGKASYELSFIHAAQKSAGVNFFAS